MYYFCSMNEDIRETFHSAEYDEYYAKVLFLNSFLKKDTKQYKGEIETARQILNKYIQGEQEDDKA